MKILQKIGENGSVKLDNIKKVLQNVIPFFMN
jgi:hypothetical protein